MRRIVLRHFAFAEDALTVAGPVATSQFSRVFRGDGAGFAGPVAIKLFLGPQAGATVGRPARGYWRTLGELRDIAADDPEFGVAEPLGVIDRHDLVITRWVEGSTLAQAVMASSSADAARAVSMAGAWLGHLQAATTIAQRPIDTDAELQRLQQSVDRNGAMARSRTVRRAVQQLHEAAAAVAAVDVIWCRSHGDFKLTNLLLADHRIHGIDFELHDRVPGVHDAAHFLNHMRLLFLGPRGLPRLRAVPALGEAFRHGYARGAGSALPPLPLAWERLRNAVHLLVRHRQWTSPPQSWATSLKLRYLVRRLRRDLAALSSDRVG